LNSAQRFSTKLVARPRAETPGMEPSLRQLSPADQPELEEFLRAHVDRAMFLRSNLRTAGIVYRGRPFEGLYVAAIEGGRIAGVAGHFWNGILLLLAERHAEALAIAARDCSGRAVVGIIGPLDEVKRARRALSMDKAMSQKESDEGLYALELADLRVPAALSEGSVTCRPVCDGDVPLLVDWRYAYAQEALNAAPGGALRARCREEIETLGLDRQFVLTERDRLVAYSAFNAALPDIVQIGGVWTPPELRGRGYGRIVVAGSLLTARTKGATRAVLFTDDANLAARRAYTALGFRRIGDWCVLLFAAT
jgi:uncharacterized protein